MPRQTDARERFIQTAASLFRQRGYHGVGLAEIIQTAGAPRGSFYHHFPGGKEELGVYAVELAGRFVSRAIDAAFSDAPNFEAGAHRLAESLGALLEDSGWVDGCPITGILVDTSADSDLLAEAVTTTFEQWKVRVQSHAKRLGVDETSAATRALRLLIALEGAWLVARIQRSRDVFVDAAEMA